MNILIAGGAGFIGSNLSEQLVKIGHQVVVVDNLFSSSELNIQHLESNINFTFINHDVIDSNFPAEVQGQKYDLIYHLASPASPNPKSPYSYIAHPVKTLLVNSIGTKHLLDMAKKNNAKFVYASTSEVYGDPLEHPQTESYWGNVNPVGVRSCYDEGKRFGEAISMTYFREYRVDVRIARIFNTYGPKMLPEDGRVVSNFIVQALRGKNLTIYGDGKQTRSFCYVSDLIEGLVRLGLVKGIEGEIINLGNSDERKIIEVAQLVKQITKTGSEIVFQNLPEDDPVKRQPSLNKAKVLLDWIPKVKLEDGIRKTIDYLSAY